MGRAVEVEPHRGLGGQRQRDVRAVRYRAGPVVDVPVVVQGDLVLPAAGGHGEVAAPDAVGPEGQLRRRAFGLPVARAPELVLEAADEGDRRLGRRGRLADDGDGVRRGRVGDRDDLVRGDRERDVRGGIGHVPRFVEGRLHLVVAGRDLVTDERVDAVAVRILEPRPKAVGLPIARAADLALEAAGGRGDGRVPVARDPVRSVRVVELRRVGVADRQADVAAVEGRIDAVVLVPGVVQGCLVFVGGGGGRHWERALPDLVRRVIREVRGGALRLPVPGASQLALQAAGDRHARGRRRMRGQHGHDGRRGHETGEQEHAPDESDQARPNTRAAGLTGRGAHRRTSETSAGASPCHDFDAVREPSGRRAGRCWVGG